MASFNLVNEPWIPCRLPDGMVELLNLHDTLLGADEIVEMAGETPLVTVALHRLLLAVLHRCFGPENAAAWRALWERGAWEPAPLSDYLAQWRHRFDLFDGERPFYQTAAVDFSRGLYPLMRTFQLAKRSTLADHTLDSDPPPVAPDVAVRLLVAFQSFDVGGIKSAEQDKDFADASPLTQCAVGLVRGENLYRTLLLNLHRYSPENGAPFDFDRAADRPAWEREEDPRPMDRMPDGYLDLLTWQSRRLRLMPEADPAGRIVVGQAVVMKGFQFPDGYHRRGRETMVAFRANPTAKGNQDPWPAVGFQEERTLWRDSLAVLQSVGDRFTRPRTLDWLNDLVRAGALQRGDIIPIDFHGIAVDRANALFWRHERLLLPLAYLEDRDLYRRLSDALDLAADVGRLCGAGYTEIQMNGKTVKPPSPFRTLATQLVGAGGDIGAFVSHLAPGRFYWSRLEEPFRRLLVDLPEDAQTDQYGERVYGAAAFPRWAAVVTDAARAAFAAATDGFDGSARTLRAAAMAERELGQLLRQVVARYLPAAETSNAGGSG